MNKYFFSNKLCLVRDELLEVIVVDGSEIAEIYVDEIKLGD